MRVTYFFKKINGMLFQKNELCCSNIKFKDLHKGQRCFILCNGPSVYKQNLIPLAGEIVFSVSNGYYHKDYGTIRPKYHCVPGLTYSDSLTVKDAITWFREMDQKIGDAELFLDVAEEPLVRKNRLFSSRTVNYICMAARFSAKYVKAIDISKIAPGSQSVSIMCLMIAIYMGFNEIYLIGTEHDSAITGEYRYFYTPKLLRGKDRSVTLDGKVKNLELERQGIKKLMVQYSLLKTIAKNEGVSIYNATLGGALEVFPRVNLSEVLKIEKC